MRLPRTLYELLPWAYLLVGAAILLMINTPLAYLSGGLFYLAGALTWVQRSEYRRQDRSISYRHRRRVRRTSAQRRRLPLPFWLYESLPFVYIGVGILLVASAEGAVVYLSAIMLWSAGGLILYLRTGFRDHQLSGEERA